MLIGVEVGLLLSFLGFLLGVFTSAVVVLTEGRTDAAVVFFEGEVDALITFPFGKTTPPAEPALPCSAWLGGVPFRDLVCFTGATGFALGPGDADLEPMIPLVVPIFLTQY